VSSGALHEELASLDLRPPGAWGDVCRSLLRGLPCAHVLLEGSYVFPGGASHPFSFSAGVPVEVVTPAQCLALPLAAEARFSARLECHRGPGEVEFGAAELELLESLRPLLLERARADVQLRLVPLLQHAIEATFELADRPVMLFRTGDPQPLQLNDGAQWLWARDPGFQAGARVALQGGASDFRVLPVADGSARVVLVYDGDAATAMRLARATKVWALTPREVEVLELVTLGKTNADIGCVLACAPRTVEIHVTRLLEKARLENRASLVARFWAGEFS
jgi:DNA-binding CsgD family transcriptional regulator